jgi:hypothetical protein
LQKVFLVFLFLVGVTISAIAGIFSVTGLTTIFRGAIFSVLLMGSSLEIAKVSISVYLHLYHKKLNIFLTTYLAFALIVLMAITSLGVYGYLSKSFFASTNTSGVANKVSSYSTKLEVEREKLKSIRDEISSITSLPQEEKKRWHQWRIQELSKKIDIHTTKIDELNDGYIEEKTKLNTLESEVGPLKYLAFILYNSNDSDSIGRAVQILIILLVVVFDPLAILLILSSIKGFELINKKEEREDLKLHSLREENIEPNIMFSDVLGDFNNIIEQEEEIKSKPIKKQKVYKKPSIPIKDKDVRKEDAVVVENSIPEVHISPTEESLDDSLLSSVIDESVAETFEQQNNPTNYEEQVQKMYNQTPMIAGRFKE